MPVGVDGPTNCAFGDPDQRTLYVTTGQGHLLRTRDTVAGPGLCGLQSDKYPPQAPGELSGRSDQSDQPAAQFRPGPARSPRPGSSMERFDRFSRRGAVRVCASRPAGAA
jgi:hypothetical protein